jgi:hypothetical protein
MADSGINVITDQGKKNLSLDFYLKSTALNDYIFGKNLLDTNVMNESKKTINIYGDFGFGGYCTNSSGGATNGLTGIAIYIDANFLKNENNLKLRFIRESELNFLGPVPGENFYDIGLLYGRVTKSKILRLSISGGLGFLGGVKRGAFLERNQGIFGLFGYDQYEKEHILTPAIPVEIDLSLSSKHIGIGLTGYANLNQEESIAGFIVRLQLGKIR